MITNQRQFRITKSQLDKLNAAVADFDVAAATRRTGSQILAEAELAALKSQSSELSDQLREYEALKSGTITVLKANNLSELPTILVRARIARGLSQRELGERLGMQEQQIQRYEAEAYASASLRRLAEVADALNLNVTEIAELGNETAAKRSVPSETIDWRLFPVKEMYKRGWFKNFSGSLNQAEANAEPLVQEFVTEAVRRPMVVLHRKKVRSGSLADPYALMAWQCRILLLGRDAAMERAYDPEVINEPWFKQLVKQSRAPDGPCLAKKYLHDFGIPLIIEPHLPGTHLDGAAILGEQGPVIGMTLRHDRLDNFWFVLIHELVHVWKHLRRGKLEQIFDDLEAEADELERETDELAGQLLISNDKWDVALPRYARTPRSINAFAQESNISPAIVAGKIRNEANNFVILKELIGAGQVRKQFPEVLFGY